MKQLDLVQFLIDNPREISAVVTATTDVKLNKKDASRTIANPFDGGVSKTQTFTISLNKDYQQAVNEQRTEEGKKADFEAQARKWGSHVCKSIVTKGDDLYLAGIVTGNVGAPKYRCKNTGREVNLEEISPFRGASSSNKSQGVDEHVDIRTYKLVNIDQVTINTEDGLVIKF